MGDKEWMTFMGREYAPSIKITSDGDHLEIVKGSGFDEWVKDTFPVYSLNRKIVSRRQADREKLHLILDNWLDGKGLSDQMPPEHIGIGDAK